MASLVDAGAAGASPLHHHLYQNVNVGPSRRPRLPRLHPRVRIAPLFVSYYICPQLILTAIIATDSLNLTSRLPQLGPMVGMPAHTTTPACTCCILYVMQALIYATTATDSLNLTMTPK